MSFCRGLIQDDQTAETCCRPEADFMIKDAPTDHNLSWDNDGTRQQDDEIVRVVEKLVVVFGLPERIGIFPSPTLL